MNLYKEYGVVTDGVCENYHQVIMIILDRTSVKTKQNKVIPVYPPFNFVEAGGIKKSIGTFFQQFLFCANEKWIHWWGT